jgi:hypothetical protein
MNKRKLQQQHFEEAQTRARSVTVGTAFGGTTELTMRRGDGSFTFAIMQPVEVIELIHQLAANVGCHLHLTPRRDFAAWRDWKYTEAELAHYRGVQHLPGVGHPPHANDMAPHMLVGANLPHPEQQPGMPMMENSGDEAVAVEAPKQRRKSKRTADAS